MTVNEKKFLLQLKCSEEVFEIAENIQQDMHNFVEWIMNSTNCTYQDATNIYIVSKLAQLQHSIEK